MVDWSNGQHAAANITGAEFMTLERGGNLLLGHYDAIRTRVVAFLKKPGGYPIINPMMFQLAAEYLVDANGHGKKVNDFKNLLLDVRNGVPFPTAFQNRFGMSLSEYESQFFALMNAYLP
ncbi:MAG: hypothetical protein WBB46_11825 [Candidatus Deferrimicrobiaceae bacterium]